MTDALSVLSIVGQRRCRGFIGWSIIGSLSLVGSCLAQQASQFHLTVRPHAMTLGASNPAAGEYPMMAAVPTIMEDYSTQLRPNAIMSVPAQCAGERRCPLVVQLPGGKQSAQHMANWLHPVANKYGFLLLTVTEYEPSSLLDMTLKAVLQQFAVDPAKIGIVGRCASGEAAMRFGIENLGVFNRIASISGDVPVQDMDSTNTTAEFWLDRAFRESTRDVFEAAHTLQRRGHPVTQVIGLRGHEDQVEDYDFLGRWLSESWAKPNPATRLPPAVVADPPPALTSDVLAKMTAFWQRFMHTPDSVWTTARQAHLRTVVVLIGRDRPILVMTDMVALAAQFPVVAAALRQAGLTAQEHDAYRIALVSAQVLALAGGAVSIDPTSTTAKNAAYYAAHQDEFDALEQAGIDDPSRIPHEMVWRERPSVVETFGPMGIWRSP